MPSGEATFEPTARVETGARVRVVSDLHLGDGGASDAFGRKDDRLRRFFDDVAARADVLVIAGDGFDVAQAWSMARICDAHPRVIEDLTALARTIDVYYLRGNHEGTGREIARHLPLRYANELTIGDRVRVEHGNALDPYNLPGDSTAFWGARGHAMLEAILRSPVRIPMRKYHCWSTRVFHRVFCSYATLQRTLAAIDEAAGRTERARRRIAFLDHWGRGEWGDVHGLASAAEQMLAVGSVDVLVCGHSHQPGKVALGRGTYVNSGSWVFDESTYVAYEEGTIEVRRWPDGTTIGDEQYRGFLGPNRDKSFLDWWSRYYRGYLRYDVEAMIRDASEPTSTPSRRVSTRVPRSIVHPPK